MGGSSQQTQIDRPFGEVAPEDRELSFQGGLSWHIWATSFPSRVIRGPSPSTHRFLHSRAQGETGEIVVILSSVLRNGVHFASGGRHP